MAPAASAITACDFRRWWDQAIESRRLSDPAPGLADGAIANGSCPLGMSTTARAASRASRSTWEGETPVERRGRRKWQDADDQPARASWGDLRRRSNELVRTVSTSRSAELDYVQRHCATDSTRPFLCTAPARPARSACSLGSAAITVTRTIANEIHYADLPDDVCRACRRPASCGSVWVAHSSSTSAVARDAVAFRSAPAAAHVPVLHRKHGAVAHPGRPVLFSEKTQPLGTLGDVALCRLGAATSSALRQDRRRSTNRVHVGFPKNQKSTSGCTIRSTDSLPMPQPVQTAELCADAKPVRRPRA